jgi:N-acetylglutamate synthase-like GNAT family acetyltransferase
MKFQVAQLSDAKKIADLVNSAYRGESSKKGWTTEAEILGGQRTDQKAIEEVMQTTNQYFLLGKKDSKLFASVNLEKKDPATCYFGMFAVNPDLQNSGIGKQMLAESEKFARDVLKCSLMEMSVITLRAELIDWYLRRGYQKTTELRPFPMHDERFGIPLKGHLEMLVLTKKL